MSVVNMTGIRIGTANRSNIRRGSFTTSTEITPGVKARLIVDLMERMEQRPGNFLFANSENGDWIASASFDDTEEGFMGTGNTAYEAMTRLLLEMD